MGAILASGRDLALQSVVNGAGGEVHEASHVDGVEQIQHGDDIHQQVFFGLAHRPRNVDFCGKIQAALPLAAVLFRQGGYLGGIG